MYAFSSFVFTAILALVRVAIATPPACLIAALGAQSNPADLASLCGSLESAVVGNITEKCSGDAEASAISVYSATCLASESVTISITSSASSSSATGSVSATTTAAAAATTIGSAKTSATGTVTGSKTATSTSSSASSSSALSISTKSSGADAHTPQLAFAILAAGFVGQYLL